MTSLRPPTDIPGTKSQQLKCGRKSNLFRRPSTPSTALSQSTISTHNDSELDSSLANPNKKRPRSDESESAVSSWARNSVYNATPANSIFNSDLSLESPAPFATTKYRLAGGLDTPGVLRAKEEDVRDEEYFDREFRRDLGGGMRAGEEEFGENGSGERSTRLSADNGSPIQKEGWGLVSTIGGVVEKVIEFCTKGTFRGFSAGGGEAYDPNASLVERSDSIRGRNSMQEDSMYAASPIPGQYPTDDQTDYMSQITNERRPTDRPAKRRQISIYGDDDLDKSWVMVRDENTPPPGLSRRSISPSKTNRFAITANSSRRLTGIPASRVNARRTFSSRATAGTYTSNTTSLRSTLPESPRTPSTSRIPLPSTPHSPFTSKIPRATNASPATAVRSPAGIQAQQWAERKRREEKDADEAMGRFNRQLKDMIREGKEALGSRVEVWDEGFEDDG